MVSDCPVCNSERNKPLDYGGYSYAGSKLPLVECRSCGLKYIQHSMSDADISELYHEESYFDSDYGGGTLNKCTDNKDEMYAKADQVLPLISKVKGSGRLLDVGCAAGFFIDRAEAAGFEVEGVEVSPQMSEVARERGKKVTTGLIQDLPSSQTFDVVYLGDVLEHVRIPEETMSEIHQRLNNDGIVVLELPLSYNVTLSGFVGAAVKVLQGKIGYKYLLPSHHRVHYIPEPPYHLHFFNNSSIRKLLEKSDFALVHLKLHELPPKEKYGNSLYSFVKKLAAKVSWILPMKKWGDRAIVIAKKN